jgi:hypothetical protein
MKTSLKNIAGLFLLLFLLIFAWRCTETSKQKSEGKNRYSQTQQYLFNFVDSYKVSVDAVKQQDLKEGLRNWYLEGVRYFLIDSLGRHIDSMQVTVDTVIQNEWLVTTQFHCRDIVFKYEMGFSENMEAKADSLYRWMRNLKPGTDVTVNFTLLGAIELNYPGSGNSQVLKIFAFPEPLSSLSRFLK